MSNRKVYWLAALSLAAFSLAISPVLAALVSIPDGSSVIGDVLDDDAATILPVFGETVERFQADGSAAKCTAESSGEPTVHAVLLAPFYDVFPLPGTQNDARLLRSLFEKRGVRPENLHVLDGNHVTRARMIEALRGVIPCIRERDQVVVSFSGAALSYRKWRAPDLATFLELRGCKQSDVPDPKLAEICAGPPSEELEEAFRDAVARHDEHILFSSDSIISPDSIERLGNDDRITGVRATELSNFATQIRNRGGDVIFILDTNYAEDFRLLDKQQAASFDTAWKWTRGIDRAPDEADNDIVELFGTGSMAALYAASADEMSTETERTGGLALGELTFAISEALHTEQNPTILQLSREIDRTMFEKSIPQVPVFEATNPEMRFLTARSVQQSNPEAIDIIEPALKRGSLAPQAKEAKVLARYTGAGRAAFAAIDGINIEIAADGSFGRDVNVGERTEIPIRVYGRDASLLSERRLLFGEDETEAQLAPVGRRLALVIANSEYSDPAYPTLQNPIRDGEAVAAALQASFGYTTKLDLGGGKERDFMLRNASKTDIQKALFDLRKRLTADDQLLVYYAGHGEIDDEETAYWVPTDGEAGADITWYRAFDITDEMRRIAAGSVLLISDSCYAGGLSRGAERLKAEDEPRDRYLANASRFKARQLISSGGLEPVEDGGGGDHSLFARALLDALAGMPDKVFTASELFEGKLKPRAVELAFAKGIGQTPGYYRIAPAGDEPSSEFIFHRQ